MDLQEIYVSYANDELRHFYGIDDFVQFLQNLVELFQGGASI